MRQDLEDKLYKDFPLLYNRHADVRTNLMAFGFECGDGWYDLIRELSEKLYPMVEKIRSEQGDDAYLTRAFQVKEKYGTLRFYMDAETKEMSELIDEFTDASASICEECGEEGRMRSRGHSMYARCDEHDTWH